MDATFLSNAVDAARDDLITFSVAFGGGILASILGLWQAMKTQPAMALGGQ